ncbi:unnamed protein product, partial [Hymenolepis diminuta]
MNGAMVAMHHSNCSRELVCVRTTSNNKSRGDDGLKKPPPIPPKPKTKRVFNGWKIIPDTVQEKLSRMTEKKPLNFSCDLEKPRKEEKPHSFVKISEGCLDDFEKATNSDDEIFIVTTA